VIAVLSSARTQQWRSLSLTQLLCPTSLRIRHKFTSLDATKQVRVSILDRMKRAAERDSHLNQSVGTG
jgi:hypothetical protein